MQVVLVEDDDGEVQGKEKNRGAVAPIGGPCGSVEEEEEVAVATDDNESKKRKMEEDTYTSDDKAVAAVAPHSLASPEIQIEQRKKRKEPDLIV